MKVIQTLPDDTSTGKTRKMVLLKCMRCGIEKTSRKDSKQTTDFCTVCNNTTHGDTGSRLYTIYHNMLARCTKPDNEQFKHYGAKGISVSKDWGTYEAFKVWAHNSGYAKNLTIDRIDCSQNYCPTNCRWVDYTVQAINRDFPVGISGFTGVVTTHTAQIKQYGKVVFTANANTALEAAYLRDKFILENKLEHRKNFPDMGIDDLNKAIAKLQTSTLCFSRAD